MSDPTLPEFRLKYPNINLLLLSHDSDYLSGLTFASDHNSPYLALHLFQLKSPDTTQSIDQGRFERVCEHGNLTMVNHLLRRGVSITQYAMKMAVTKGYLAIVERFLTIAIRSDKVDMVDLILRNGKTNPTVEVYQRTPLQLAMYGNHREVTNRLLSDPRVKPTYAEIQTAIHLNWPEIVTKLVRLIPLDEDQRRKLRAYASERNRHDIAKRCHS